MVAEKLNYLGELYLTQGRYYKAEVLFLEAIDIWRSSLVEEYPKLAFSLNNLGLVYLHRGHYSKAEALILEALDIHRRFLEEEHPTVAIYLQNLAIVYVAQGKYFKAEPLFEQSRKIVIERLGTNHLMTSFYVRNSNLITDVLLRQWIITCFSLLAFLIARPQGIIPGLTTTIIILTIALGPLSIALVLLFLIGILLIIIPVISRTVTLFSKLFVSLFCLLNIRLLFYTKINFKTSPLSAVRWLFIKEWTRFFTNLDDLIIFQREPSIIVSRILNLVSFILEGIFALSLLIVILTPTLIGVLPSLIAGSATLLILMEQLFAATSLLVWLGFLWRNNLEVYWWAGWLFFSLGFLTLMLVGVKLILKWLRLRFRLLSAMQRGLRSIGSYALSKIQALYNVFSFRKSR